MKVSIVTVCLNAEKTIEQTIDSVINQTYTNIEYIIIDGKSNDKTLDIIYKYANRISVIVSESDKGIYDAMNKGVERATGEVIGILNADDWYEKDTIEKIVEIFQNNDSQIVHGNLRFIWEDGRREDTVTDSLNKLWFEMVVRHPATFVRKEVYQKLGGFDNTFKIAGDYEFILRCYANKIKFYYYNRILTNFRMTGISNQDGDTCFDETKKAALRYVEKSPNKEENYLIIYDRINKKTFSNLLKNGFDSVQFGDNLSKLLQQKKVQIWGSGKIGRTISSFLLQNNIDIVAFRDSNCNKVGKELYGIKIKNFSNIETCKIPVLIAIAKEDNEVKKRIEQLRKKGLKVILLKELMESVLKDNNCFKSL